MERPLPCKAAIASRQAILHPESLCMMLLLMHKSCQYTHLAGAGPRCTARLGHARRHYMHPSQLGLCSAAQSPRYTAGLAASRAFCAVQSQANDLACPGRTWHRAGPPSSALGLPQDPRLQSDALSVLHDKHCGGPWAWVRYGTSTTIPGIVEGHQHEKHSARTLPLLGGNVSCCTETSFLPLSLAMRGQSSPDLSSRWSGKQATGALAACP
jgi:hypothetical protein